MKKLITTFLIFLLFIGNSIAQSTSTPETVTAFINATVIDGTGAEPLENATVVIKNKRIACIGECEVPIGAKVIDASGEYIIPGLVDAHIHYNGSGWVDTRPAGYDVSDRFPYEKVDAHLREYPERFHRSYLCSGVTAVLEPGGPTWTLDLRNETRGSTAAPHHFAAGPLLTAIPSLAPAPSPAGLHVYMADEEAVRFGVQMISWLGGDAIKIYGLEMTEDRESMRRLLQIAAEEAEQVKLPLIAHAPTLSTAKDALRAGGASILVHPVSDTLVDDEFLELARSNNAVYVTTMGRVKTYLAALSPAGPNRLKIRFPEEEIPLECIDPFTRKKLRLTDSLPVRNIDPVIFRKRGEKTYQVRQENLRRVHEAGITIATGTDSGIPFAVHGPAIHTEMETMADAGLTPMEVLVASTRNGAKAMGRLDDFGTLEEGKIADMVVLEKNPLEDISNVRSIELVVRGGKVWTHDELKYDDED